MNDLTINIMLIVTYVLLGIGALGAIIFPIVNMFGDLQKAKRTLIGIGSVGAIFLVSYLMSGNEVVESYVKYNVTETSSQLIGASLIMMYIMGAGAILLAIVGEIYKAFK